MGWSCFYITVDVLRVVRRFLLRSALIVLAGGLGTAAVIVSVNFAAAGRRAALNQIARMGLNALTVTPQPDRGKGVRTRTGDVVHTLVAADYNEIRQRIPLVTEGSPVSSGQYRVKAGDLSKMAQVVGCLPSYRVIKDWKLSAGEWFSAGENRRGARVAVLGARVALDIFGTSAPVGRQLSIERTPFLVIGVVEEHGQGLDAVSEDDQIYVPLQTAMHRLSNVDYYTGLLLEVRGVRDMDDAASGVEGSSAGAIIGSQIFPTIFRFATKKRLSRRGRPPRDSLACTCAPSDSAGLRSPAWAFSRFFGSP